MSDLYIGMISGTSVDGVDAVLAELDRDNCRLLAAVTTPYPADLHRRVHNLIATPTTSLQELGAVDHAVGKFFAQCALAIMGTANVGSSSIAAVGHHGQTIFHQPAGAEPFTLQIGDPNVIAAMTGITTVADFRRLDMAHGGQGAPLVPAFHAWRFASPAERRVVLNVGGIANLTVLDPREPPIGFDTGPGNTLLDLWIRRHRGADYDRNGDWAATGRVDAALLRRLLDEAYFAAPPPKSTGRELFNSAWLDALLASHGQVAPVDVQATLAELTAASIADAMKLAAPACARVIVCGGGAHNADLMVRLQRRTSAVVESSGTYGISPDWVEAAAFAWLAQARLQRVAGNVPSVTGAHRPVILGGVYWGPAP